MKFGCEMYQRLWKWAPTKRSQSDPLRVHPRESLLQLGWWEEGDLRTHVSTDKIKNMFDYSLTLYCEAVYQLTWKAKIIKTPNIVERNWYIIRLVIQLFLSPLSSVVFLHNMSWFFTGEEEISGMIKLQINGVFIYNTEVILLH